MKTRTLSKKTAELTISSDELGIINNALNEVCNGIHLRGDFETRMGCTRQEARQLLETIHSLLSQMGYTD